jgi:hypothetical protein
MGIYIYSVRTKNLPIEIEGVERKVFALQYLTRTSYYDDRPERLLTSKAESIWEDREAPEFVYMTDVKGKPYDGAEVYEWTGAAWDYDTPCFERAKRVVGYLRSSKVGRKTVWSVVPSYFSLTFGTMKDNCLHIRKSKILFDGRDAAKALAFAEADLGETVRVEEAIVGGGGESFKVEVAA